MTSEKERTLAGLFGCRPAFLQPFNKPIVFLVLYSLSSFWMTFGVSVNVIISPTLESLFNINSKEMGFIFTANDITGTIAALVMANFCAARKIRWITIGAVIFGLAGLVTASAQLFVQLPDPTIASTGNVTDTYAVKNYKLYWMHVLGALLQGIGLTPLGIAGTTYLDEVFSQRMFGVAVAVLALLGLLGIPLADVIGSLFLKVYVNITNEYGLVNGQPQWIGAWWLGYLVPALIVLLFSVPIMFFPQQMPAAKRVLDEKIKAGITTSEEKKEELKKTAKELMHDLVPVMKKLGSNTSYIFMLLGDSLMWLYYGSLLFYIKFYIVFFRVAPPDIGAIFGYSKIFSLVTAMLIGVVAVWVKEYSGKQAALVTAICGLLCTPFIFSMLMYCPLETRVGIDVPYSGATTISLDDSCRREDVCDTTSLTPMCHDGLTYISVCHAGCLVPPAPPGPPTFKFGPQPDYTNCTCIPGGRATYRGCGKPCKGKMIWATVLSSLGNILALMSVPVHNILNMRIVSETDRTVAQGVRQFATRIIGTLPSPIIFGALIDNYCTVWRYTGDVKGNCLMYDTKRLMIAYCILQFVIRVAASLCHFACWYKFPINKSDSLELAEVVPEDMVIENKMVLDPSSDEKTGS